MRKLFFLFLALTMGTALWANRIIYTASEPISPNAGAFDAIIQSHAFSDNKGIIEFNGDVYRIGAGAFSDCSEMTSITLPNTIKAIGMNAFSNCNKLASITFPNPGF